MKKNGSEVMCLSCAHTVPVSCLLSCAIINPFRFQNCPGFGCILFGHLNMGDKPKNYGVSKKETITTGPGGLIEDISEEKFSLQTNKQTPQFDGFSSFILGIINKMTCT